MRLRSIFSKLSIVVPLLVLSSCQERKEESKAPTPYQLEVPAGFPEMNIPDDNPLTEEAIALGRELFFDPMLSKDYSVSCASCHLPAYAFADTIAQSPGVHKDRIGNRNSYSLANVGYLDALFMEGGVPSLELQVLAPLGERNEMDLQLTDAVVRMKENPAYVRMAEEAYGRVIDPWVITRALAAYERTLISSDSPFDRYLYGKDEAAISDEAKAGWQHFQNFSCTSCHAGPLLTNQGYYNIGLYEDYSDPGRGRFTDEESDHGKFRVPSLRNVALTAPYMHNGSMKSLSEVVDHFSSGGYNHPNKSQLIRPLNMSEVQKMELLSFLNSLTDSTFINNENYLPMRLR